MLTSSLFSPVNVFSYRLQAVARGNYKGKGDLGANSTEFRFLTACF